MEAIVTKAIEEAMEDIKKMFGDLKDVVMIKYIVWTWTVIIYIACLVMMLMELCGRESTQNSEQNVLKKSP